MHVRHEYTRAISRDAIGSVARYKLFNYSFDSVDI